MLIRQSLHYTAFLLVAKKAVPDSMIFACRWKSRKSLWCAGTTGSGDVEAYSLIL